MICALLLGPAPARAGGNISVQSFTGPATATIGQPITLSATMTNTSGTPGTVDVRETVTLVSPAQTVGADGLPHAFQYLVTPSSVGSHTYRPASTTIGFNAGGHTATVAVGKASTTTSLSASTTAPTTGQSVTFTATVSGFTPTGTVTFMDGAITLGTATLSGGTATFTTAALSSGSHAITAVYGGDGINNASSSAAVTVTPAASNSDSAALRALQLAATKVVAQNSGQAITGSIDDALTDGFSDGGGPVTPAGTGLHVNFAADPDQSGATDGARVVSERWNGSFGERMGSGDAASGYARSRPNSSRADDAFAAIARNGSGNGMATKAPPLRPLEPRDWMLWADVRGAGIARWDTTAGSAPAQLSGSQVNALLGLTRRVAPSLLVGVVGGYETFDYRSQDLNGRLKGNGWTVGSYLGWKLAPAVRFDAAVAYSGIGYDGTAATAQGNFDGRRWLLSGGLTGAYQAYGLDIAPSARVYALWEHENAYTDSLGTRQADRDFATGRASGGVKLSYPFGWRDSVTLAPYAGLYGDYYFSHDNAGTIVAAAALLPVSPFLDGWSARATAGLAAKFSNGAAIALGGEYGGIGNAVHIWTYHVRAAVPF